MARVLVIDDDQTVCDVLEKYLTRKGFEVVVATDGDVALDIHRKEPVDLVLTDILMPQKEGFETIRDFKNIDPNLKIVAMSGGGRNGPETYLEFAKTFGADEVFEKPMDLGHLVDVINELLAVKAD